ncbi:SVSP family protein [Theileria parva strain Muguga]|uniref:Theileria-specific sub-telomeric protein, SVSP family n=1 Tax=Theileria parva TaxID=5875 RepID=Q4MYF8_THEPA|nr:SVSP family protein [Theileria parva strain Muguga]EAN30724.1 SVSP family protein [Theileria parva strain Muguga]|eukprot:XP_763007.1 hypothetical protein [Theileria parva strain Muguga]
MNKNIAYNFVLIFIIIKYVQSQDNDPDQPSEDNEDDYNFDVSDLDEIIEEETAVLINPQYQPQYQQLQESQYPTQLQTQPQHYDLYQGESQGYQPELLGYQPELLPYQHESLQYQPESSCYQTELLEYDPYKQYQVQTQEQQLEEPQHHYYGPPLTQTVTQTQSQEPEQYYGTAPIIQPQQYPEYQPESSGYQPESQGYQPESSEYYLEQQYYPGYQQQQQQYQTDTYGYYQPPAPTQQITQQQEQYYITPPHQPSYQEQYYEPPVTQPTQQPSYQNYYPGYPPHQPSYQEQYYEPPVTQPAQQQQYYGPPTTLPQRTQPDQYYVPPPQQTTVQPSSQPRYQYYRPNQPIEERETETGHETTQKSTKRQNKQRKRTRATSGDQTEKKDGEESVKRIRPLVKKYDIKFYKRNYLGKLVEMIVCEYVITYTDTHKTKYNFYADLQQIECGGEIVYVHTNGRPYCSSLTHSKRTEIIVMTNSDGFTIINKVDGEWTRTDANIPDYVKFYKRDSGGNEILITNNEYNIDFTSLRSFRYTFLPGVRCHKVQVGNLVPWKKTEDDDNFPELIYVSPKLTVILKFYKYTKVFEKRGNMYQYLRTNKNLIKAKYT